MEVFDAIQSRRSIRKYSARPIEDEKLMKVLEAARLSPSAGNRQNWKFVIVKDEAAKKKVAEASDYRSFIEQAPAVIAACGTEPGGTMRCGQSRYTVDLSIAAAYMLLEAHELELGTCWIGNFDEAAVKAAIGIPDNVRVVMLFPIGYAEEHPEARPRKPINEIVCFDKYC